MSFHSFLSDTVALRQRAECFVEISIRDKDDNPLTLTISRRGTNIGPRSITISPGDDIAAFSVYEKRLIGFPSLSQSMWNNGEFLSRSIPSNGSIQVNIGDRKWDQYHPKFGYQWAKGTAKVYYFDPFDITNTIGKTFDGSIGQPDFSSHNILSIPLLGKESAFDVNISERIYRGTLYWYEMGQGARTITYGTTPVSKLNITGDLSIEKWIYIETANTGAVQPWFGFNGAPSPYRLVLGATRTLGLFVTIAGLTQSKTSTFTIPLSTVMHISVKITGRNVIFEFWNEDTQILTTETYVNAFTVSTRDGNTGGDPFIESTQVDATFRYWTNRTRIYNTYRSKETTKIDKYRQLDTIPTSCKLYCEFSDGTGTTITDLSASPANGVVTGVGASQWLSGCEGGKELAGTIKPDIWGMKFGVKAILVGLNGLHNIWNVAGGGRVKSILPHEGGAALTLDTNAVSWRAFLTTTPTAGRALPYRERGLIRLPATTPLLPISCTVEGYDDNSVLGYVSTGTKVVRDIITRRGPKLVDPTDLVAASFNTYPTEYMIGISIYDRTKINEVLDLCMKSSIGWWGYLKSENQFRVQKFVDPGVSSYDFTETKIISIKPIKWKPIYQVVIQYRFNDLVLTDDQIAASVKGTSNWQKWKLPYSEKSATSDEVRGRFPGEESASITLKTGIYLDDDAQSLANECLLLLAGYREAYQVILSAVGLETKIGESESLSYQYQDKTRVLYLDGSRTYLIVTTQDNRMADGTVENIVVSAIINN